jgi:hypothetical protein
MSSTNGNYPDTSKSSANTSKRNIGNRKYIPSINQARILATGGNNASIPNNQSVNIPPKHQNKEFVIKNKIRR